MVNGKAWRKTCTALCSIPFTDEFRQLYNRTIYSNGNTRKFFCVCVWLSVLFVFSINFFYIFGPFHWMMPVRCYYAEHIPNTNRIDNKMKATMWKLFFSRSSQTKITTTTAISASRSEGIWKKEEAETKHIVRCAWCIYFDTNALSCLLKMFLFRLTHSLEYVCCRYMHMCALGRWIYIRVAYFLHIYSDLINIRILLSLFVVFPTLCLSFSR